MSEHLARADEWQQLAYRAWDRCADVFKPRENSVIGDFITTATSALGDIFKEEELATKKKAAEKGGRK